MPGAVEVWRRSARSVRASSGRLWQGTIAADKAGPGVGALILHLY